MLNQPLASELQLQRAGMFTSGTQRSDLINADLWGDKYYNRANSFSQHQSTVTNLNHNKQNYYARPNNSTIPAYSSYNQPDPIAKPYYCGLAPQSPTQNMNQWQHGLQNQQLTAQPLAPKLNHVNSPSETMPNEVTSNNIAPSNRFQDMFLRAPNPANYFMSCLNSASPNWVQSNASKESYLTPPVAKNICPLCGKNYARPSTLKTHMRIHSGERPFHCKVCNKSFSQAANLTAHLRVHSGEKPFSCAICRKTFSQSSSVTTHMRTHSGDRPYKCPICQKGFSDSSTLTKHMRIHSGEKPYRCNYCSMSFSQSGNLNRHMKVHEFRGGKDISPNSNSQSVGR